MDLEELHKVVVQGFASVNDRIDSGLAAVNGRIDSVVGRIDALEAHMHEGFGRVQDALLEHGRQLKDIRVTLDRKVDRDELQPRH